MSETDARPKPGPREERAEAMGEQDPTSEAPEQSGTTSGSESSGASGGNDAVRQVVEAAQKAGYGDPSDGQAYLDRDAVPFDPAEGLYSGTAVQGDSEIAGPHQSQEPVGEVDEEKQAEAAKLASERPEAAQGASTPTGNVGKTEGND